MPDFAEMPQFSFSTGAIRPVNSHSTTTGIGRTGSPAFTRAGGWKGTGAPGGLLIQAPGLVLPMLHHRGSLFNLGMIQNLPPLGAQAFDVSNGGGIQFWWDSPNSWGRANFLVRRARTLIVAVQTSFSDIATVASWVSTNYTATFQPLNLSVLVTFLATGLQRNNRYAIGVPVSLTPAVNQLITNTIDPSQLNFRSAWANIVTDPTVYVGGDYYVASLCPTIFPFGGSSVVNQYAFFVNDPGYNTPSGWTQVAVTNSAPDNFTVFVNNPKINAEMLAITDAAPKFNTFAIKLYQYNVNPTLNAFGVGQSPNPALPDSTADSIIASGAPFLTRNGTFSNGDLTSMLAQVLTDVTAFFPQLP